MSTELTDREILEACARARSIPFDKNRAHKFGLWIDYAEYEPSEYAQRYFNPLTDDGDCARMENKCGVQITCGSGEVYSRDDQYRELFTPGNDAERRRASCLVVARAQLAKEQGA